MLTKNPIITNIYIAERVKGQNHQPYKALVVDTSLKVLPSNDNIDEYSLFRRLIDDLKSLQLLSVQGHRGIESIEINGPTWRAYFKNQDRPTVTYN